jgi:hypothetical protein
MSEQPAPGSDSAPPVPPVPPLPTPPVQPPPAAQPPYPTHPVPQQPYPSYSNAPVQPPYPTQPQAQPPYPTQPQAQPPYPTQPQAQAPYPTYVQTQPPHSAHPQRSAAPRPVGRPALGIVALVLGIIALVAPTVAVGPAAFTVGLEVAPALASPVPPSDLAILAPVRSWVLVGEIAFWTGTVLGIWAIAQAIVAITRRRGRGQGIAAVVIAPLGFVVFVSVASGFFFAGLAAGAPFGP